MESDSHKPMRAQNKYAGHGVLQKRGILSQEPQPNLCSKTSSWGFEFNCSWRQQEALVKWTAVIRLQTEGGCLSNSAQNCTPPLFYGSMKPLRVAIQCELGLGAKKTDQMQPRSLPSLKLILECGYIPRLTSIQKEICFLFPTGPEF